MGELEEIAQRLHYQPHKSKHRSRFKRHGSGALRDRRGSWLERVPLIGLLNIAYQIQKGVMSPRRYDNLEKYHYTATIAPLCVGIGYEVAKLFK